MPPGSAAAASARRRASAATLAAVATVRVRRGRIRRSASAPPAGGRAAPRGRAASRNSPSSREQQRHVVVVGRQRPADAERPIERFAHQAGRLGFVGQVEPGIDAGFERELAQQRQAERVDGGDGDVGETRRAPRASARDRAAAARRARRNVSRMRCRISAAALRVKVIARMCRGSTPAHEQVDIAIDQHARLAGAGRGLERDVCRGWVAQDARPRGRARSTGPPDRSPSRSPAGAVHRVLGLHEGLAAHAVEGALGHSERGVGRAGKWPAPMSSMAWTMRCSASRSISSSDLIPGRSRP